MSGGIRIRDRSVTDEIARESEVVQQIRRALAESGHDRLLHVHVAASRAGAVTLQGAVSTFYEKQMAQELTRRVDGVHALRNEITVEAACRPIAVNQLPR